MHDHWRLGESLCYVDAMEPDANLRSHTIALLAEAIAPIVADLLAGRGRVIKRDDESHDIERLRAYLSAAQAGAWVARRDIGRHCLRCAGTLRIDAAVSALVSEGWLEARTEATAGRGPKSRHYRVRGAL